MQQPEWNTSNSGKVIRHFIRRAKSRRRKTAMETTPQSAIAIDSSVGKAPVLSPEPYAADPCGDASGGFQKGNSCGGGGSGGSKSKPEKSSESKVESKQDADHVPGKPILRNRPIAERLAAYHHGEKTVKAIQDLGTDHQKAKDEVQKHRENIESIIAEQKGTRGAKRKSIVQKLNDASSDYTDALRHEKEVGSAAREKAHDLLKATNPIVIKDHQKTIQELPADRVDSARKGLDFISKVIEKGNNPTLKSYWRGLHESEEQRAYYHPEGNVVVLGNGDQAGTAVHELGHHLDYQAKGFNDAAKDFLAHRVGNEPLVELNKLKIGSYSKGERGRKDKFEDAFGDQAHYVGKYYPNGITEVTSMGLEKMHDDPIGFATKDPEYAKFIIGLMSGALR